MSSRREVLIRILAPLQRKTLLETKNRTLKQHYSPVQSMKNVAVLTEDGTVALFSRLHPGGFDSSRIPTSGNLHPMQKMLMPGGQPGGVLGAAGIDCCITDPKTSRDTNETNSHQSERMFLLCVRLCPNKDWLKGFLLTM